MAATGASMKENNTRSHAVEKVGESSKPEKNSRTVLGNLTNTCLQPPNAAALRGSGKNDAKDGVLEGRQVVFHDGSLVQTFENQLDDVVSEPGVPPVQVNVVAAGPSDLQDINLPALPDNDEDMDELQFENYEMDLENEEMDSSDESSDESSEESDEEIEPDLDDLDDPEDDSILEGLLHLPTYQWNPLSPEYDEYVVDQMHERELDGRPEQGFMSMQAELSLAMRTILVDWMIEVAVTYEYRHETLFLAVSLVDRYLEAAPVARINLQLVGTGALLMAGKVMENDNLRSSDLAYLTEDAYPASEVRGMARLLLHNIGFDLSFPTTAWFARRLLNLTTAAYDDTLRNEVQSLTFYLCYLAVLNEDDFLIDPPSMVAASALCLARRTLKFILPWDQQCVEVSQYELVDLEVCVRYLHQVHRHVSQDREVACCHLFELPEYAEVSLIEPEPFPLVL
ncbi:G2/mitotic-specific cyclin-A-like [Babylonia areolata]|uniref:G2/mitotic-specific cyclin-A-like n=1 Tax=Babylonia areolata TaxID=304850 RepID=UPI003FD3183D